MSAARKSLRNAQIASKWRNPTAFRARPLRAVWVEEDGSGPCWGPARR